MLRSLAKRFPDLAIPILTGASAGALNAVALANHPGSLADAVDELSELWANLTIDQVFRVDRRSLASHVARFGVGLVAGGARGAPQPRSLVDTAPLRELVTEVLGRGGREPGGIAHNLDSGRLRAVAITTTCYTSGRSVTWVEGRGVEPWARPQRVGVRAALSADHVLASAALPLLFPAVRIGDAWHGDGDVRLAAPLSPALHLGARRILAVSTRFTPSHAPPPAACASELVAYPTPAQVIGMILNAVFVDGLEQDALRLVQVNELLMRGEERAGGGLRPVDLFVMRPSRDLGELATHFERELPSTFRWLTRGLGTHQTRAADSLSFILFQPAYLRALITLGERDAESYAQAIESFVEH
ncbi:MAG: patatin-like phospholipase family protein [Deltaproteobacteria bacterium]|nr:patatin-like phospholipase family protein [Deltaproteobacteria bacterium]